MKGKLLFLLFFFVMTLFGFPEEIVVSRSQLSDLFEQAKTLEGYTPDELYRIYKNNELKYENQFYCKVFVIEGRITTVRRSILDEYIVELKCNENWVSDLAIVYPKKISVAMREKLMNLSPGDYYKALVVGRESWYYVDVPVWNAGNGVYRTEP